MDIESLAKELILKNMNPEQQLAVLDGIKASVAQAKEVQKQRIGENVGLVVDALKKIESDIRSRFDEVGNVIEKRVATIKDGKDGKDGRDGRNGKDGRDGKQGVQGVKGEDGRDGRDGVDGIDGVSVTSARIDFDGSLIIGLSSGIELNVGEVVAPDLAESIKVITNGGGTSQSVLDTLASLQTQITNLIPSQTGNSGKFLTTNGTALSWSSVAGGLSYQGTWNASTNTPTLTSSVGVNGYYYIVATAGSTNLNGITDWQIGDWLMFNGSVWQKIDQSNLVTSVNGQTGAVSVGTVTSVSALTLGTSGTDLSSTVATSTTTPVITLNVPTASATNRGVLSSADWTTFNNKGSGTITSVTGTAPVVSSGGATPAISLATAYGDTLNPYASKTANFVLAAPNGSAGVPTFRAVVAADIPTLNQNTTGSASGGASGAISATTLSASSTVSGTGFTTYLASPPAIGGTAAAAGSFTTLSGSTSVTTPILKSASSLTLQTNGTTTAVTIDTSQNVGIGNTSPASKLDVTGKLTVNTSFAGDVITNIVNSSATGFGLRVAGGASGSGYIVSFNDYLGTNKFILDGSGNVGIGTSSPAYKLDVLSATTFVSRFQNGSNQPVFAVSTSGLSGIVSESGSQNGWLMTSASNYVIAYTSGAERMRITSAGGVSFGATGTAYGTSGQVLQSNGNAAPTWVTASGGASISNDTTTSTNLYPLFAAATSGTPTTIYTGNTKYLYKPSTGELSAPAHISSNGININSATVSASYTIASGNNGFSVGPITVASGQAVTVASGQRWVVL